MRTKKNNERARKKHRLSDKQKNRQKVVKTVFNVTKQRVDELFGQNMKVFAHHKKLVPELKSSQHVMQRSFLLEEYGPKII